MLAALLLLFHAGLATTFSAHDPFNPSPLLGCPQRGRMRALDDEHDVIVAHRTLPCDTRLWIYDPRTRRSVIARVADRGPVHAAIDLAPAVRRALRHSGRDIVFFVPLGIPHARGRWW